MIYFVQRANGDIKIGTTENFQKRFYGLRSTTGEPLSILGVCDGGWEIEDELHAQFGEWRVAGEWFRPSGELLAYIKENATQPPKWKERAQHWKERLELEYGEAALTLIPRLVIEYGGFKEVARIAGVYDTTVRWWCRINANAWYKWFVYERKVKEPA